MVDDGTDVHWAGVDVTRDRVAVLVGSGDSRCVFVGRHRHNGSWQSAVVVCADHRRCIMVFDFATDYVAELARKPTVYTRSI